MVGQHLSPATEFKNGHTPWNKGKHYRIVSSSEFRKGQHYSPKTEFSKGRLPWNKKTPPKIELEDLYIRKQFGCVEIAGIYNVSFKTVCRWLHYYQIPIRSINQRAKIAMNKPETKKKTSQANLKSRQEDPSILKRCLTSLKPNKKEKVLDSFIQTHLPNEWKYVGNGEVNLGGRSPDWININGKKQVIELFGNYWHDPFVNPKIKLSRTEVATRYHYSQYGFDCLVIWQKELDKPIKLLRKIKEFSDG